MIKSKNDCVEEIRKNMRGGDGKVSVLNFADEKELYGKGRLFAKLTLKPGCGIGYHVHEKDSEIFYVLKGRALYSDGGDEREVGEGDVLITPAGCGHAVSNRSDGDVEFIALIVYAE